MKNFQLEAETESVRIDYKRVLYRAIRYWYIIVASLAITLTIAFTVNRYTPNMYPVTASIIIKETEETSGAGEFLYENPLVNPFRNYLNELYIIKSYPLIESVIDDLNFSVTFFKEGNILTTEVYGDLPFSVEIINKDTVTSFTKTLQILNEKQFQLSSGKDGTGNSTTYNFNQIITVKGVSFMIASKRPTELKKGVDPLIF